MVSGGNGGVGCGRLVLSLDLVVLKPLTRTRRVNSISAMFGVVNPSRGVIIRTFSSPSIGGIAYCIDQTGANNVGKKLNLTRSASSTTVSYRRIKPVRLSSHVGGNGTRNRMMFGGHASLIFGSLRIIHFCSTGHGTLTCLTCSSGIMRNSPGGTVDTIPIVP